MINKTITIIYTDKFSKRNVETSNLIELMSEKFLGVKTIDKIDRYNFLVKNLWRVSYVLDEVLKYRFLEVNNIKKQLDKHKYQKSKNLHSFDKLKKYFGWPFPKSKFLLSLIEKIYWLIPTPINKLDTDFILLTSMQNFIAANYIKYAEKENIPVVCLLNSWDHLTHGKQVIKSKQILCYLVWNNLQKNELINLHGIHENKIKPVGALQFDFLKDIFLNDDTNDDRLKKSLDIPSDYKIISLLAYNQRLGKNEPYVIQKILDNIMNIDDEIIILIRPYPFDDSFDARYSQVLMHKNTKLISLNEDFSEDRKMMSLMMKDSDIVLSGPGTAAIEAMYYDTPVIHIGMDANESNENDTLYKEFFFSDHYKHIMSKKASFYCLNTSDLINSINKYLKNPSLHKLERKNLIEEQLYSVEKKSSELITLTCLNVLEKCE